MSSSSRLRSLTAVAACALLAASPALAAVAMDGSATGSFKGVSGALNLTSGAAGDIIVVAIVAENYPKTATAPTISSITSSGLTFAVRRTLSGTAVGQYSNNAAGSITSIYWAYASSKLTAQAIRVTMGAAIDCASVVAFAVSGADTATPFDINAALPAAKTSATHSAAAVTAPGVSTTNANTMLIGVFGGYNWAGSATFPLSVGSGFTSVGSNDNNSCTLETQAQVEQKIVAVAQGGATLGFANNYADFYLIVDAIQQAGGGGGIGATPSRSLMGVGQ